MMMMIVVEDKVEVDVQVDTDDSRSGSRWRSRYMKCGSCCVRSGFEELDPMIKGGGRGRCTYVGMMVVVQNHMGASGGH
jgi:hypothetical protein